MARTNFTFTFTNAQPGSPVTFSYPVYADGSTKTQDGPQLILDANKAVSVWADSDYLIAVSSDGNGLHISGTATKAAPSVTVGDGTAPTNPFGNGGSSAVTYSEFVVTPSISGLVAGVNTGLVVPEGKHALVLTFLTAVWDGTTPTLGLGASQASAVAVANGGPALVYGQFGLTNPDAADGNTQGWFGNQYPISVGGDSEIWVAVTDGAAGAPGSTTGEFRIRMTIFEPAA